MRCGHRTSVRHARALLGWRARVDAAAACLLAERTRAMPGRLSSLRPSRAARTRGDGMNNRLRGRGAFAFAGLLLLLGGCGTSEDGAGTATGLPTSASTSV